MGLTNFPNGISSFGLPVAGNWIPTTFGTVYFVNYDNGSDGNTGKEPKKAFKTLEKAYAMVTSNKNDVIVLSWYSSNPLAAQIVWSKNRVHVIWTGTPSMANLQWSKVEMAAWISAQSMIRITGVRNTFTNIKFTMNSAETAVKYAIEDWGEWTMFNWCAVNITTKLNATATSDIVFWGDSCSYINCTFWNDNLVTSAARNVASVALVTWGSADGMKNCYFENCVFKVQSSSADALLFKVTAASALKFSNVMKNCDFINTINQTNSAIQLTVAFWSIAWMVEWNIFIKNPWTNCASFATTSTNLIVQAPAASNNAFEWVTPA